MAKTKKPGLRKVVSPPKVDLDKLDQFAAGAKVTPKAEEGQKAAPKESVEKAGYPWHEPWVRSDVIKGMGVPLSEPHLLKLQYIAQNTRYSQRRFCREKLEAAIDQEIKNLVKEGKAL